MPASQLPVTGGDVGTFTVGGLHRPLAVLGDQDSAQTARVSPSGALYTVPIEDVNRVRLTAYAEAVAGGTTEALMALVVQRSGEAATAASTTALVVTAGKRFRLQQVTGSITLTGTTVATTRLRLRYNPGGAVALTSPIAVTQRFGGITAVAVHVYRFDIAIPDGMDFLAGTGVGVSAISTAAMHSIDLNLVGYEYAP